MVVWLCVALLLFVPEDKQKADKQKEAEKKARIKRLIKRLEVDDYLCLLYTSPSPRD